MYDNFMIYFYFDITPKPKSRPRFGRVGTKVVTYSDPKSRAYEKRVKQLTRDQYNDDPLLGPIRLEITYYIKPPKTVKRQYPSVKPDLDNLNKSILDAMESVAFKNDSQIIGLTSSKYYRDHAGVEVKVYPVV